MSEPLTQEQMEKLQDAKRLLPRMEFALKEGHKLTKGVHDCKPDCFKDGFVSCHEWWRLKEASAVMLLREKIDANPIFDHLKYQSLRDAIKATVDEVFGK